MSDENRHFGSGSTIRTHFEKIILINEYSIIRTMEICLPKLMKHRYFSMHANVMYGILHVTFDPQFKFNNFEESTILLSSDPDELLHRTPSRTVNGFVHRYVIKIITRLDVIITITVIIVKFNYTCN